MGTLYLASLNRTKFLLESKYPQLIAKKGASIQAETNANDNKKPVKLKATG